MAHTNGPWNWVGDTLTAGDNGKHLIYVEEAPGLGREAAANASLICAAPDLLAALEKAQRFIASTAVMLEGRGPVPEIVLLDIQNAIAKAKGE